MAKLSKICCIYNNISWYLQRKVIKFCVTILLAKHAGMRDAPCRVEWNPIGSKWICKEFILPDVALDRMPVSWCIAELLVWISAMLDWVFVVMWSWPDTDTLLLVSAAHLLTCAMLACWINRTGSEGKTLRDEVVEVFFWSTLLVLIEICCCVLWEKIDFCVPRKLCD